MRGREFLRLSSLLATTPEEAAIRTRTSRAYYAAYLEARTFCEREFGYIRVKQSREHQDVPNLLRPLAPDIVGHLTFLRNLRNIADYDLDVSTATVRGSALQAELLAHEVVASLDSHGERLERERAKAAPTMGPDDPAS